MTTSLTIQLDDRVRQRYARASRRLRQALGEEAGQQLIETVRGAGYRLAPGPG